jgi:hypothetical protein
VQLHLIYFDVFFYDYNDFEIELLMIYMLLLMELKQIKFHVQMARYELSMDSQIYEIHKQILLFLYHNNNKKDVES